MATTSIGSIEPVTTARSPESMDAAGFTGSLETYISDIVGVITILAALFFIVYSFLAAFEWVTAGGESGKIEKAKNKFIWGTLGLVLIVASYAIIGLIGSLVGISILNPGEMLKNIIPGITTTPSTTIPSTGAPFL